MALVTSTTNLKQKVEAEDSDLMCGFTQCVVFVNIYFAYRYRIDKPALICKAIHINNRLFFVSLQYYFNYLLSDVDRCACSDQFLDKIG